MDTKYKVIVLVTAMAGFLSLTKFAVGMASGSMAVMSSGLDSLLDTFISGMNFFAIKKASMPPDKTHQYGHGKIENFSALVESFIITSAGVVILYNAIYRFVKNIPVRYTMLDLPIMIFSLIFSFFVTYVLKRASKKTGSMALSADAAHYASDVYTNSGAILAIILTYLTGYQYFDFAFALIIGIIIVFSTLKIFLESISGLMDKSIPEEIEEKIKKMIEKLPFPYAGFHKLRTRTSGNKHYIDFHLLVCRESDINKAHEIAEKLEDQLKKEISGIDVTIHIEPCNSECDMTEITCSLKLRSENKKVFKNNMDIDFNP
ncbi:MAG TPA: cation diffusion facilitator family transporter [Syntrophorhabdaceae bacterium]|nr:cation diffusion facilitator family transporter [Syntrophorhabdaceae bacterium]